MDGQDTETRQFRLSKPPKAPVTYGKYPGYWDNDRRPLDDKPGSGAAYDDLMKRIEEAIKPRG